MNYKELLKYIPDAMRVVRMMLVFFLVFDYPFAAKCLLFMICCELAVGRDVYNKVRAGTMDVVLVLLNILGPISYFKANLLIMVIVVMLLIEIVIHVKRRIPKVADFKIKNLRRWIAIGVALFALYVVVLAVVPYMFTEEVSDAYKESLDVAEFYGDAVGCDKAAIIDDNGDALKHRIMLIENASEEIIMSTFTFKSDNSGKQVMAALSEAAQRGVKVRILLDGFNSVIEIEGNPYFMALAMEENVEIKIYNEANVLVPWKGMSRMHDKYIIADHTAYILGGRNTFDNFLGEHDGYQNYDRDVLVYNTGGDDSSVYDLKEYFEGVWSLECCELWNEYLISGVLPCVDEASEELTDIYELMKQEHWEWFEKPSYDDITVATNKVTLLTNPTDIYMKEPWVFYGLCQLMMAAKEEVVIHTPYIIADDAMYGAYTEICKNVDVTLVTNEAANNGNLFGAIDYILNKEKILKTGLNLLEYDGSGSYHAKSMTIDDNISVIGSFNMDYKSMYHDTEIMVVIDSVELNKLLKESHRVYQDNSVKAKVVQNEISTALAHRKWFRRVQGRIIAVIDPYVRYLF